MSETGTDPANRARYAPMRWIGVQLRRMCHIPMRLSLLSTSIYPRMRSRSSVLLTGVQHDHFMG
jgi:hypothetical protein